MAAPTRRGHTLRGFGGNDTLHGMGGNDIVDGGAGVDSISGEPGADALVGGLDPDYIDGGADNDTLFSRDGINDLVFCGTGTDSAYVDTSEVPSGCEAIFRP